MAKKEALEIARRYGQIDGDHHKAWVIDQMVRALTDCPTILKEAKYVYFGFGESEEYKEFLRSYKEGEDGPETYEWNEGIPP